MAVGGIGMCCTANYAARKFGVRSAMPGFIARKLCLGALLHPPVSIQSALLVMRMHLCRSIPLRMHSPSLPCQAYRHAVEPLRALLNNQNIAPGALACMLHGPHASSGNRCDRSLRCCFLAQSWCL